MKSLRFGLAHLVILAALVSCGKDNESGKKTQFQYPGACLPGAACSPYMGNVGMYPSQIPYQNIASIANLAQQENPCATGTYYSQQRIPVQTQLSGLKGIVASGDYYVGVTSYGDVAVLVGNGTRNAMLYAYLCPRVGSSGQGYITPPTLGSYSQKCNVKGIVAMDIIFPDGYPAKFRDPSYGRINPITQQWVGNFSFCSQYP